MEKRLKGLMETSGYFIGKKKSVTGIRQVFSLSASSFPQAAPPEPVDPNQWRGEQLHWCPPPAWNGQVQL